MRLPAQVLLKRRDRRARLAADHLRQLRAFGLRFGFGHVCLPCAAAEHPGPSTEAGPEMPGEERDLAGILAIQLCPDLRQ